jgi:glycosyltransferase involved in cell wall biosynthesis
MQRRDGKIRVCFISPKAYEIFNPETGDYAGGAEVDFYYLATEIARDGNFEVSCIVADYGQKNIEIIEGVTVLKSLDFRRNAMNGLLRVWAAFKSADADIYVIECASAGVLLTALFCKKYSRIFAYRTAHLHECDGTYLRNHPLLGRAFAWSLRQADMVVAQNETDVENLKRTTGVSSRVLPNSQRIPPVRQQTRDTILWVGRSDPLKNPHLFLELVKAVPNEHFTMICQTLVDDRNFKNLIAQAGSIPNLQFIRHVPFNQIDTYFQRARVFVSTSTAEGFPNTFIQACKCGTPILSFSVNPDGFLGKYHCGFCADGDRDLFFRMLQDLLIPQNAQQYGANGRRYAEENHDIVKIAALYKQIFKQLTAGQSTGDSSADNHR